MWWQLIPESILAGWRLWLYWSFSFGDCRNLHNVPRALMPCVSLTLSLYHCVFLFVFWCEFEHSCATEMVNADQMVHQLLKGGFFMGVGWGRHSRPSQEILCYKVVQESHTLTTHTPSIKAANLHPFDYRGWLSKTMNYTVFLGPTLSTKGLKVHPF